MVNQYYEAQVYDVFVIKGNTALFKCQIPSFVADHVEIIEWATTDGQTYGMDDSFGRDGFLRRGDPLILLLLKRRSFLGFKIFKTSFELVFF